MKKSLIAAFLIAFSVHAQAEEQVRLVQSALSEAGFYFGKADGTMGEETRAALRRFQIRNGLDVTGTATPETLSALKLGTIDPAASKTERTASSAAEDEQQIARSAPTPEAVERPPARQAQPAPVVVARPPGRTPARDFFIDTDLEDANPDEQSDAILKAQNQLARLGYFRGLPNGLPSPETETGLLKFQHDSHLRLTGRLDTDTREALVNAPPSVPTKPFRTSRNRPPRTALRGIWIH